MINLSLIELENELDISSFFRVNRQYLVNKKYIKRIKQRRETGFDVIIDSGEPITIEITAQRFSRLKEWIENT